MWAGQNNVNISAKSLIGLRVWHNFHNELYPEWNKARIDLLLHTSSRLDATTPANLPKLSVMLWHLMSLVTSMYGKSDFNWRWSTSAL
jgi:hypothetical protein